MLAGAGINPTSIAQCGGASATRGSAVIEPDREGHLPDSTPSRVLVVDDLPGVELMISRALEGRYVCEFTGSVAQAREMLSATAFDLALCDVDAGGSRRWPWPRRSSPASSIPPW
jgi:PleD family two-component response regulator